MSLDPQAVADYLHALGWTQPVPRDPRVGLAPPPRVADLAPLLAPIAQWATFTFGPQVVVDAETLPVLLATPRCGTPDRYADAATCRWPHKSIRFWHDMAFAGIPAADVDRAWRAAVASWAEVCGIEPAHAASKSSTNIFAHAAYIDGRGSTLAWSYLPCGVSSGSQLEQRYDSGDPYYQYGLAYLQEVMAHEIGHALGLDHAPASAGALMSPFATGKIVRPTAHDIRRIQALYGPPKAPAPDPPEPVPPDDPLPQPPGPTPTPEPGPPRSGRYRVAGTIAGAPAELILEPLP